MAYDVEEAKKLVVEAGKKLLETGLIARTWGNVSARISDTQFVITPSGRAYDTLTPDEVVVVNIDDCSHEGDIKPSSEKGIHADAYKHHPLVNFVIHTHQKAATIVSITGMEIKNVYVYSALVVLGTIGQTVFTMLIWALVTDCLDYSEWKFNERSDGSMYSLYTFSRKIGSTIASTGVSFGLAAIGFVSGSNVVQTAEAVNGIYFLVNIIPVVTCALELIGVGLIFNLNKETTEQMYAELKAK